MSRRVLVVDDDPALRQVLTDLLADEGYDVVTAPDGELALERVREQLPAVILLDYQVPRCDGRQFAAAPRRRPGGGARVLVPRLARAIPEGWVLSCLVQHCMCEARRAGEARPPRALAPRTAPSGKAPAGLRCGSPAVCAVG